MNDSFLSTGLLGPGPSVSPPAFVSNGLLGTILDPDELNDLPSAPISDTPHTHYSQSIPHSSDNTSWLENDGRPPRVLLHLIICLHNAAAPLTGPLLSSQGKCFSSQAETISHVNQMMHSLQSQISWVSNPIIPSRTRSHRYVLPQRC